MADVRCNCCHGMADELYCSGCYSSLEDDLRGIIRNLEDKDAEILQLNAKVAELEFQIEESANKLREE